MSLLVRSADFRLCLLLDLVAVMVMPAFSFFAGWKVSRWEFSDVTKENAGRSGDKVQGKVVNTLGSGVSTLGNVLPHYHLG